MLGCLPGHPVLHVARGLQLDTLATGSQQRTTEALRVLVYTALGSPQALSVLLMQVLLVLVAPLLLCHSLGTGIFAGIRSPRAQGPASFGVPCGRHL